MLLHTYSSLLPLLALPALPALLLSFFPAQTTQAASSTTAAATTAYDALQSHGLPKGLLPTSIKSFTVNASSGRFQAIIHSPCTATFDSGLHYNRTISGKLSYGEIASLSGVQAQDLFLWFPVLAIRVDVNTSGFIYFDVGVVYKRYPVSFFESPPLCTPDSSLSISKSDLEDSKHVSTM